MKIAALALVASFVAATGAMAACGGMTRSAPVTAETTIDTPPPVVLPRADS